MADSLNVTPAGLRAAADHLADVSARMQRLRQSLNSRVDTLGRPWGDDETGRSFADGDDGYLAQKESVNGSVDAKTKLLDDYAGILRTAADSFEQQDNST